MSNSAAYLPDASNRTPSTRQCDLQEWFFWLLLFALVAGDQMLTWQYPDADPEMGYSQDNDLTTDGYWYLAEARGWVEGQEAVVGAGYRKPLVSVPAYGFYSLFGVGIASSRALSGFAALATLILLVALLRRRFGSHFAIVGGMLLVVEPAWHVFARSPVIYPWVGFWLLCILAAASGRGLRRWLLGVLLLILAASYLKSLLWLALPALAFEGWIRLLRANAWCARHRVALASFAALSALLGALTLPLVSPAAWEQLRLYFGESASLAGNIFGLEEHSRLFSAAPILVLLSWAGALGFLTHAFPTRGPRTLERMIHVTIWISIALFSLFSYAPLRYLSVLVPLLVYLTVSTLHAAANLPARRLLPLAPVRRALTLIFASCGSAYIASQLLQAAIQRPIAHTIFNMVVAAGYLCFVLLIRFRAPERRFRTIFAVSLLVLPVPLMTRTLGLIDIPDHSLKRAGEQLARIAPAGARFVGPFAHALTIDSGLPAAQVSSLRFGDGALRRTLEGGGYTHLLLDRPDEPQKVFEYFRRDGVELELVEAFHVRGEPVLLMRLGFSALPPSPYERGMRALAAGEPEKAEECFLSVLDEENRFAPAWTRLGQIRASIGDRHSAYACYLTAVLNDPTRVQAHVALSAMYYEAHFLREARFHMERALAAEPDNPSLRREVQKLAGEEMSESHRQPAAASLATPPR